MAKGRKPDLKPDYDNLVQLHSGRDAVESSDEDVVVDVPCPEFLSGYAKECWDRLALTMTAKGWLQVTDQPQFETFCRAYDDFRLACDELDKLAEADEKRTYQTKGRYGGLTRTSPWIAQKNEATRLMRSIGSEFGLTPSARQRLIEDPQGNLFGPESLKDKLKVET